MREANDIREGVRDYIVRRLLDGDARGFDDDTDLLATRIFDSFSIVEFTLFLQETYGREFRLADLDADNYRSVAAIARMVQSVLRS